MATQNGFFSGVARTRESADGSRELVLPPSPNLRFVDSGEYFSVFRRLPKIDWGTDPSPESLAIARGMLSRIGVSQSPIGTIYKPDELVWEKKIVGRAIHWCRWRIGYRRLDSGFVEKIKVPSMCEPIGDESGAMKVWIAPGKFRVIRPKKTFLAEAGEPVNPREILAESRIRFWLSIAARVVRGERLAHSVRLYDWFGNLVEFGQEKNHLTTTYPGQSGEVLLVSPNGSRLIKSKSEIPSWQHIAKNISTDDAELLSRLGTIRLRAIERRVLRACRTRRNWSIERIAAAAGVSCRSAELVFARIRERLEESALA